MSIYNHCFKKALKLAICCLGIFSLFPSSFAVLTTITSRTIQGDSPQLSPEFEEHIDNSNLFGLTVNNKNYYGDDINNMFLLTAYPFKKTVSLAPIRQPNDEEYFDLNKDELEEITTITPPKMTWYYTNAQQDLVEFTPTDSDTFCSLSQAGKKAPYKVKISADIHLSSKTGDPRTHDYPNEIITEHPSKTYTLLSGATFCYARPELKPTAALGVSATQWDKSNGFLVQSTSDATKNFPTTGFYGAKFDLLLSEKGIANDFNWSITEGDKLISISNTADFVTVKFNTPDALNSKTAWEYVVGSGKGYTINVQGVHKTQGYTINYPFTITKWFTDWDPAQAGTNKASSGSAPSIIAGCESREGTYRISYTNEVTTIPANLTGAATVRFSREIGTLLGEWGDATQKSYPNSWAAATTQANAFRRIWLYDSDRNKYCDLHTYDALYHCIAESGLKNGVCTAVSSR